MSEEKMLTQDEAKGLLHLLTKYFREIDGKISADERKVIARLLSEASFTLDNLE